MTPQELEQKIRKSAGRDFRCTFIKADGSEREMWARYAVVRPVSQHREEVPGRVTVWDCQVEQWRTIIVARVTYARIDGCHEEVRA